MIGAALAAWFVVWFIKRARECLRSKSSFRHAACFGALAGLFAVAIHSIFDFGLHVSVNALIFTALIVIATVNLRVEEQKSQSSEAPIRVLMRPPSFTSSFSRRRIATWIRPAVAVIGLIVCVIEIRTTGLAGLSRLSSDRAERQNQLASANQATHLSPSDPVARHVRATVLLEKEQFPEAIEEFRRAVALRPTDHDLWLNLGFAYDQSGDQPSALAAFSEAARLAPYYAGPRWQLGNLLFRMGQREQAFAELRRRRGPPAGGQAQGFSKGKPLKKLGSTVD
jgi:tetratricopeptide (TPR) repeat protein